MSISAKLNNRPSCETRLGEEEEESASSCETNDLRELIHDYSPSSSSSNISIVKEEEETVQHITSSSTTSNNVEDYGFFFIVDEETETKTRKALHDDEIILR
jgi:hypothetical protein